MKVKNILICSVITGVLFLIFDMLIGISTSPIFSQYSGLPIWKISPNILAGSIFDLINGFILVLVYVAIYKGIPGYGWRKGLNYGIIVGLFRVLMASFSAFVMYDIPSVLILANFITGFIEIIILCIILAVIYERLNRSKF